jgi:hypothetical protein
MNKASKNDKRDVKADHSLLAPAFKDQVAYCMMAGEIKYGTFNYLKGHTIRQLMAATSRHMDRILAGEDYDEDTMDILENGYTRPDGTFIPGTGKRILITHNACISANQLMFLHQKEVGTLIDDRYTQPSSEEMETVEIEYTVSHPYIGGEELTSTRKKQIPKSELKTFLATNRSVKIIQKEKDTKDTSTKIDDKEI